MKYKMRFVFLVVAVFSLNTSFGQRFYERNEYGVMAGASQYFGELNPGYSFKTTTPAFGGFFRYYFNPYVSMRMGLSFTQLSFKDSYSDKAVQKVRNLSFSNNIVEAMVLGEFNFVYFMTGTQGRRFTPYMVLGIGAVYSNPYVKQDGQKVFLQPLGTEGQNLADFKDRKYNKVNVVAPFGVGVKTWLAPGVNLGVELVHRFAFTDYLDDVSKNYVGINRLTGPNGESTPASNLQDPSLLQNGQKYGIEGRQRGDQAMIDQYLMGQITLSFQLKTYRCPSEHPLWNQ